MTDLRPLIRLHRWRLDEMRRGLAELHGRQEGLMAEAERLEQEIANEQRATKASYEISFGYAAFARAAIARRGHLAQSLAEVRERIAAATEDLAEAFQELKRYELAQEERQRQEKEQLRHKENQVLDEAAAIAFIRRENE